LCQLLHLCTAPPPPPLPPNDNNQAGGTVRFGFSDTSSGNWQIPAGAFVSYLRDSGATIHRVLLNWQYRQPTSPTAWQPGSFTAMDDLYQREIAAGVRPLL